MSKRRWALVGAGAIAALFTLNFLTKRPEETVVPMQPEADQPEEPVRATPREEPVASPPPPPPPPPPAEPEIVIRPLSYLATQLSAPASFDPSSAPVASLSRVAANARAESFERYGLNGEITFTAEVQRWGARYAGRSLVVEYANAGTYPVLDTGNVKIDIFAKIPAANTGDLEGYDVEQLSLASVPGIVRLSPQRDRPVYTNIGEIMEANPNARVLTCKYDTGPYGRSSMTAHFWLGSVPTGADAVSIAAYTNHPFLIMRGAATQCPLRLDRE